MCPAHAAEHRAGTRRAAASPAVPVDQDCVSAEAAEMQACRPCRAAAMLLLKCASPAAGAAAAEAGARAACLQSLGAHRCSNSCGCLSAVGSRAGRLQALLQRPAQHCLGQLHRQLQHACRNVRVEQQRSCGAWPGCPQMLWIASTAARVCCITVGSKYSRPGSNVTGCGMDADHSTQDCINGRSRVFTMFDLADGCRQHSPISILPRN